MEKKQRTTSQVREFVAAHKAKDDFAISNPGQSSTNAGGNGSLITGPHLHDAVQAIDLIPNPTERKIVFGLFSTFPKYQTLAMLLDENGKWFKKWPEIMGDIADKATAMDAAALTSSSEVGRSGT